jgi:hypothetical protein
MYVYEMSEERERERERERVRMLPYWLLCAAKAIASQ